RAEGARILFELKQYDEALALIQTSLQLQPADSRALNTYGAVLLALGRRAEAVSVLEQAVKADPEFTDAKSNLEKAKEQK
ncbi:MAG TPA: tetratricopeptide repeat protein, partial [Pyrinomonadaceae bacterium]|nr:tetratricopeptide repeat protein [Pyrinomonadaceae bacterium]